MQRTLLLSFLCIVPLFFSGCASYYGYTQPYGMYGGCGPTSCGECVEYAECGGCGIPSCNPYHSPLLSYVLSPISCLLQGQYCGGGCPGNGCSDEIYWGDYGLTPGDYCSPCTPDGYWAGSVDTSYSGELGPCGITGVCQRGLSYLYPAIGSEYNRCNPLFNDKVGMTRGTSEINYGLRGPCFDTCYDSCNSGCSSGCSNGTCGTALLAGAEISVNLDYQNGRFDTVGHGIQLSNGSKPCNCGSHSGDTVVPGGTYYEDNSIPATSRETIESTSNVRHMKQSKTARTAYPTPTIGKNTVRR